MRGKVAEIRMESEEHVSYITRQCFSRLFVNLYITGSKFLHPFHDAYLTKLQEYTLTNRTIFDSIFEVIIEFR